MKKSIQILLLILIVASCSKKKDDPAPNPVVVTKKPDETPGPAPIFKKMNPSQNECNTGTSRAVFVKSEGGKDVYTITDYDMHNKVIVSFTTKVWWESGVPKSDVLVFSKYDYYYVYNYKELNVPSNYTCNIGY